MVQLDCILPVHVHHGWGHIHLIVCGSGWENFHVWVDHKQVDLIGKLEIFE
jgi:hypothetical protein